MPITYEQEKVENLRDACNKILQNTQHELRELPYNDNQQLEKTLIVEYKQHYEDADKPCSISIHNSSNKKLTTIRDNVGGNFYHLSSKLKAFCEELNSDELQPFFDDSCSNLYRVVDITRLTADNCYSDEDLASMLSNPIICKISSLKKSANKLMEADEKLRDYRCKNYTKNNRPKHWSWDDLSFCLFKIIFPIILATILLLFGALFAVSGFLIGSFPTVLVGAIGTVASYVIFREAFNSSIEFCRITHRDQKLIDFEKQVTTCEKEYINDSGMLLGLYEKDPNHLLFSCLDKKNVMKDISSIEYVFRHDTLDISKINDLPNKLEDFIYTIKTSYHAELAANRKNKNIMNTEAINALSQLSGYEFKELIKNIDDKRNHYTKS
ncbi:MAG: hypothetical protein A3E88_03150 [Legionellales bacterium RIFCSPHIGHO2_12_FULL_35_11]|nr:MAG: hypothetical protein A3E88_03150 [Legionellales bacterium RIFCSPHIGHO2_12_FULL_35_11]